MNRSRILNAVSFSVILMYTASCGESSRLGTEPRSAIEASHSGDLSLVSCTPLPYDSASAVIGSTGGTIQVGPHTLTIPQNAVDSPVTITAVIESGSVNAIRFSPEGLQFNNRPSLTMSYANCGLVGQLLPKQIVYTTNLLEIVEGLVSFDSPFSHTVTAKISHFSDYAVAW